MCIMNQAYADEKKEKAKRNLNELSEQIAGKSAEEFEEFVKNLRCREM